MIAGRERVENRLGGQGVNQETPRSNLVNIEWNWHLNEWTEREATWGVEGLFQFLTSRTAKDEWIPKNCEALPNRWNKREASGQCSSLPWKHCTPLWGLRAGDDNLGSAGPAVIVLPRTEDGLLHPVIYSAEISICRVWLSKCCSSDSSSSDKIPSMGHSPPPLNSNYAYTCGSSFCLFNDDDDHDATPSLLAFSLAECMQTLTHVRA